MDASSRSILRRHLLARVNVLTAAAHSEAALGDPDGAAEHRCVAKALAEVVGALEALSSPGRAAAQPPVPVGGQPCPVCGTLDGEPHYDWCETVDPRVVGVAGIEVESVNPRNARVDGDDLTDLSPGLV